jgi:hypothetical protein
MVTIRLTAHITEDGRLEVSLPAGLPPGEVDLTLELPDSDALPWELRPWTDEEIAELTEPGVAKSGAEIVAWLESIGGIDSFKDIDDPVAWLKEQRRKRQEQRK